MWERFTAQARRAVYHAQEAARRRGVSRVGPEHLLYGILSEPDCAAVRLLGGVGVEGVRAEAAFLLRSAREGYLGRPPADDELGLSPQGGAAIGGAATESRGLGHGHVGTGHLLLGVLRSDESASRLLALRGAYASELRLSLRDLCHSGAEGESLPPLPPDPFSIPSSAPAATAPPGR